MQKAMHLQDNDQKRKAPLTLLDRYSAISYSLFGSIGRRIARKMPTLKESILRSNLRLSPESLVSTAIFSTLISLVAAVALTIVSIITASPYLMLSLIVPFLVFILMLNLPKISQSSRSYGIENELPFLLGYMVVLAGGGVNPIATLKRIAGMSKILPASAKEAKRILIDIEVFGKDPISALERAAKYNPNKNFSEFLYGYTTLLKTGGDILSYLNVKTKEIFDKRSVKIKTSSETIGTLAEAYMSVTSLLGITLFVLYEVQTMLAHNSSGLQSLFMYEFLVVPLFSFVIIWILDGTQPKQPYIDLEPYKALVYSFPVGIAILLIPLPIKLFVHVAISISVIFAYPSIVAIKRSRERAALEKALPNFIRDVAEERKIGLSPEASIEQLISKNYGKLSLHIRKMGSQLSWGINLRRVMNNFVSSVNSWLTKVIGTLMLEVVDVGGGTVKSFSDMADFTTKINDLESERRSTIRPFVFLNYISAIMIIVSTFLMVYLVSQATSTKIAGPAAFPPIDPGTIDLLFVATVFQSAIVGLVAGKMGENGVSDGFKHSLVLVLMSLLVVFVARIFVPIPI